MHANHFHTLFQIDAAPHTDRPLQSSSLLDPCTHTNQRQLLEPRTTRHVPLEYAVGPHLQCYACRMRDSHSGSEHRRRSSHSAESVSSTAEPSQLIVPRLSNTVDAAERPPQPHFPTLYMCASLHWSTQNRLSLQRKHSDRNAPSGCARNGASAA